MHGTTTGAIARRRATLQRHRRKTASAPAAANTTAPHRSPQRCSESPTLGESTSSARLEDMRRSRGRADR